MIMDLTTNGNFLNMRRLIIFLSIFALFQLIFSSCYYDNEEALYPSFNNACDTTNVTFSGVIVPILSNNCYSCHSNKTAASSGNNIRLENYSDVQAYTPKVIVSIKQTGQYTMPKNGGKLKACSITQFDLWIRNGMHDN